MICWSQCADALERDAEFAGAQRWRWRHVYVDEFQDLNPLQHRLLLAWLGPSRDLFVVGDPHQAIYGWNGADPDLLAQVPRRWPCTEVIHLDANHRCTRQIVAAAAAVLGPAGGHLHSAGREGPQPAVRAYPSEIAEARGIAAEVRRRHAEGRRWGSHGRPDTDQRPARPHPAGSWTPRVSRSGRRLKRPCSTTRQYAGFFRRCGRIPAGRSRRLSPT